ncbi:UvrD-helicase domain-containing protein, partial [Sphingomonas bacterium]|uniref:UvrD-helicase domain-containing protein n=1 Tax=Sphingomonas bacterium TaxID=1895847 RepID=UPI001574F308
MSGRIKPLDLLRGAQADASHPERLVWLSASAGTGKTHVLTARVLRLLLSGADPAAILCLTFTKAGAAEMADRIQARLASWVRMPENKLEKELFALGEARDAPSVRAARRLFARVLDAPGGGLRIQTIHAFAQTLLAAFPAEAGLVPGFRPLEGRAEAALARETLGRLLVEAERGSDLGLIADVQTLSRRLGEEKAENYLKACARAPQAMAELGGRQGIEARVRTALDVWLDDIEARIAEECSTFDCAGLRAIRAANLAWGTKTGLDHADRIARFLDADAAGRAALLPEMIGLVRTKEGSPKAVSTKLLGCDPAHGENCEALADALALLLGQRSRAATAA